MEYDPNYRGQCECGRKWDALGQAHCAGRVILEFSVRNGNSLIAPRGDAVPFQETPDGRWIVPYLHGDFLAREAIGVEPDGLYRIDPAVVSAQMMGGGNNLQVFWSIVGLNVVDVMNVLVRRGRHDDPVLVGLDVLVRPDKPSKFDVPIAADIPLRLTIGRLLPVPKLANGRTGRLGLAARGAAPPLSGGIRNTDPATDTDNGDFHGVDYSTARIVCQYECHEHFNSDAAFDRHRTGPISARRCIPAKRFSEPFGKRKQPLLVLVERNDGPAWVTALRDSGKGS